MNIQDICIQGDPQRGKDIIKFFEVMGVKNRINVGAERDCYYYYASETGDQGSWIGAIEQTKKTLIRLQPNSLLPESWCVTSPCQEVIAYLNDQHGRSFTGWSFEYYGEDGKAKASLAPFGLLLTESQFLALSGYKPEQKEQREIVGYFAPFEIFNKSVPKGAIFEKSAAGEYSWRQSPYNRYVLPAEIVEQWEVFYKEEKKPLFITEDGKAIYKGDCFYAVSSDYKIIFGPCADEYDGKRSALKYFYTREAAEQYIIENKACLSFNDIVGLWTVDGNSGESLKRLIESKLK